MSIKELYTIYKECKSVSTDSRKILKGSIFFALRGDNFNGNKYALTAIENGCSYAVVDDPDLPNNPRLLFFPDTLKALQDLAHFHRKQLNIPFIAITGSNGKTTSKELIAAVLSEKYKVCATRGNLNNHIGVPLTLLNVDEHEIAIIEMGANHLGEIALLSSIAEPDYGIITNIGRAHLEGFGSPEGVIKAKSELYDFLKNNNGKAFVNVEDQLLTGIASDKKLNTIFYGNKSGALCYGKINSNSKFLEVELIFSDSTQIKVKTHLVGDYNLSNIVAAACIGYFFEIKPEKIVSAIQAYVPSNSRSQLLVTPKNRIVMDAYNANPSSMEGAISNFISLKEKFPKMIILGDMLELGQYSYEEHLKIINILRSRSESNFLVGQEFCKVAADYPMVCFKNVEELVEHFRQNPVNNHSILLKGSRGIRLEKLLEVL